MNKHRFVALTTSLAAAAAFCTVSFGQQTSRPHLAAGDVTAPAPTSAVDPSATLLGLAWADVDADGHADVLAPSGGDGVVLFRSLGDGTFEDVTELWGLAQLEGVHQAAFADLEGDGLPDLFVLDDSARLFANTAGSFVPSASGAGLADLGAITAGFWHDYDGDGAPDLVLRVDGAFQLLHNDGDGTLSAVELPGRPTLSGAALLDGPLGNSGGLASVGGARSDSASDAARESAPAATAVGGADLPSPSSGVASPTSSPSVTAGGTANATAAALCAGSLIDQATASCLTASSDPVLGMLFPLTQDLFVASNGYVGLGTTSPARRLEIHDTQAILRMDSTGSTFGSVIELQNQTLAPSLRGGINFRDAGGIVGQFLFNGSDDFQLNGSGGVTRMHVDAEGQVGIGTTQPKRTLHVDGDYYGRGEVSLYAHEGDGQTGTSYLQARDDSLATDVSLRLRTQKAGSNVDVMQLSPDGYVGIGTVTPTGPLRVQNSDPNVQTARIEASSGAVDNVILYHNGSGKALNASSSQGIAIRASGGTTGLEVSGSTYGVDASTGGGIALQAVNTAQSSGLALNVVSNSSGPAMIVSSQPNPNFDSYAAFFEGKVQVGDLGTFGLPLTAVQLELASNGGGAIAVNNLNLDPVVELGQESSQGGFVRCRNVNGTQTIVLDQDASDAGYVGLYKADGTGTIILDADSGGNGRVVTDILEIRGGADLVESFDTREGVVEPGTVLVIDPHAAGGLTVSREPYDAKVAGVVSGAGGVRAGLSMGQEGVASGDTPVALTGRVFVKASAENGAIRPGDRLTTAATPGHAMRVTDDRRAPGSVIGKAMTALDTGTGLVLVLVNLH